MSSPERLRKKESSGGLLELIRTVVYAVLIALVVRTFAFEPFNIPSGSMIPTLLIGDYLFVSKFSYGYSRHSLPLSPPLFSGRVLGDAPERGDVAVFKLPRDNETDYIKRVIGLPGDRIQVRDGVLHINGQAVPRERIEDYVFVDETGRARRVPQYVETLPNGLQHRIIEMFGDVGPRDDTEVFTVPADHYFMMGDNRDNSADSREGGWFVPAENLVGRAEFLFFSLDGASIRFNRLFDAVN